MSNNNTVTRYGAIFFTDRGISLSLVSYGDHLKRPGEYATDTLKMRMSSAAFLGLIAHRLRICGDPMPVVVCRTSGQDSEIKTDLLEGCEATDLDAAIESAAQSDAVDVEFSVRLIRWGNDRKCIDPKQAAEAAAWDRVERAWGPSEYLALARNGHRNRVAMLEGEAESVTGCAYDNDGPCSNDGEPCATDGVGPCPYDTPERAEKREAMAALLALINGEYAAPLTLADRQVPR